MNIPFIPITDNNRTYYLCKIPASVLVNITYVARRGETQEEGAVQRILNRRRISKISSFILNGGYFPNNIILNVPDENSITVDNNQSILQIDDNAQIAQIIDGQHRVAGLKEAYRADEVVGRREYPVLLAINMNTAECASMFVSINNEQQQVPKTLIYDLYGLLDLPERDYNIDRGHDIAEILNSSSDSPFQGYIKFPNSTRFKGGIQLSAFVNNIKPLVKKQGEFEKYGINTLDYQSRILMNYFNALKSFYGQTWYTSKNPFIYTSGFGAAVNVLINKILPQCSRTKNYKTEVLKEYFNITRDSLPLQSQVKGMSGEAGKEYMYNHLVELCSVEDVNENEIIL